MDTARPTQKPVQFSRKNKRVLVLGATGTIGRATVQALVQRGHHVICVVRPRQDREGTFKLSEFRGATLRLGEVTDPKSLAEDGFRVEKFDCVVSCLASRTGTPKDAWAIDYQAHVSALAEARKAGVTHFVLLSAICVQKPLLGFQHAKLAFEKLLMDSGLHYSIIRPTAYFKSLSGQIERLKKGKPFLVFGDGKITSCKPISDDDLGRYIAECVDDETRKDRILPIGGPGAAITPLEQGEKLFALLGRPPKFKHVPVGLLDIIIGVLGTLGHVFPWLADKAELARIGRYYATESMLVFDQKTGRYDAAATPSTGSETLFDYYKRVINGEAKVERGDHAVF
jgi:divinyl chlorophyllide a 8-vinyl-reductase